MAREIETKLELAERQLEPLEAALRDRGDAAVGRSWGPSGRAWFLSGILDSLSQMFGYAEAAHEAAATALRPRFDKLIATAQPLIVSARIDGSGMPTDAAGHSRNSEVAEQDDRTAAVAERGLQGAGEPLPFREQIQASFGRHDVSNVRAHVGGPAKDASHELDAHAFTSRGQIAFARQPDLWTAAHEAAHVVQQRRGVGAADEEYERHADLVATKVVRGESVEALLDQTVGTGSDRGVVQFKKRSATGGDSAPPPNALGHFLYIHDADLRAIVIARLRDAGWPDPASDVRFAAGGERLFTAHLLPSLLAKLTDAEALCELVRPGDLVERFHAYVDLKHAQEWRPFGIALAQLVQWAARDALVERVGPRYQSIWASRFEPPDAAEIVGSHPMDALVARALTTGGVVDLSEMPAAPAQQAPSLSIKGTKSRGSNEKAKGRDNLAPQSSETPAPSVRQAMDIELSIGKRLDGIRDQVAPLGLKEELRLAYEARANRVALLADADDATRASYLPELQFQHAQLIAISGPLGEVVPRYWPLRGLPDYALTPERRAERDRLHQQLSTYVRAAATSHDREKSTAILRQVEIRRRQKERDSIDAQQIATETDVHQALESSPFNAPAGTSSGLDMVARQRQSMIDGTAKGRSTYEQRKARVAGAETALRARMQSAEYALERLRATAIEVYGDEEGLSRTFPQLKPLPAVILEVQDRLADVDRTWTTAVADKTPLVLNDPHAPEDWADWEARENALPVAQQTFAKIAGNQDLATFLNEAAATIRVQAIVNAVVQLAAALLITIATGMGAAALGARASAALATEGSAWGMRALAMGVDLSINVTINTAVQLAVSQPTRKRKTDKNGKEVEESDYALVGSMLLENLLMDGFMRTLSSPLRKAQDAARAEAREILALPHLERDECKALASFNFAGAGMAIDFVGGMTTQWAAHHLVETYRKSGDEISEPFAMTVLQQGAAVGLGKFFHGQLAAWHTHREALAKTRIGKLPEAKAFFAARDAFYTRSKQLAESLSPEPAAMNELLHMNEALIQQERALVSRIGDQPAAPKQHVDSSAADGARTSASAHPVAKGVGTSAAHEPAAPEAAKATSTSAAEVHALTASLPVLDLVDATTGVEKGPAYERDMAKLRQFYAEMEAEAQHGVPKRGVAIDGGYGWEYGHKAFTFSHGLANFEVRVHLDGSNVSGAELKQLKQQVHAGVDHHYNIKKLMVRGHDGVERRLHLEVVFVDNPSNADINVVVMPGNGYAHLNQWYVEGNLTTHAHEVAHGTWGFKDEYVDPRQLAPDRLTRQSRGVYEEQPPSIMGNYWIGDPIRDNTVAPGTTVKQRHLDQIGKHAPSAPPKVATSSTTTKQPPASATGNTAAFRQAIDELASVPVSALPAGTKIIGEHTVLDRDTYYLSPEHGGQMLRALAVLEGQGLQTRVFKKGFIVRRGADEWYFEFHTDAAEHGAKPSRHARDAQGLPPPNAATVELWGFRGVREIHGRPETQWTAAERAQVEEIKRTDPLLYAGHIGISLDGGRTIVGFNPEKPRDMDISDFLKSLFNHDAYPGIVQDDTDLFRRATKMAAERGWNTHPITAVELVDKPKKLEMLDEVARLSNMAPGTHGLGFSFPLKAPAAGEHFAGSNGYEATCVRNCAAFPEKVGVHIPDPSGNLRRYIPQLESWSNEEGPKDFRSKGKDPTQ